MVKNKRVFTAVVVAVCIICCFALTACQDKEVVEIVAENYRENFVVGDTFELGSEFVVFAISKKGEKTAVTSEAEIRYEKGFDMNVAGDYLITVIWGEHNFVYKIYVADYENQLKGITLDTSHAKTTYKWGETISYNGLKITSVFENAQGNEVNVNGNVRDFEVKIVDKNGIESGTKLEEFGRYKVIISKGAISAQYEITVDGVDFYDIPTVVKLMQYGKKSVNYGTAKVVEKGKNIPTAGTTNFEYKFGDNYTYIKETSGKSSKEYHYSLDGNGKIQVTTLENGSIVDSNFDQAGAMDGIFLQLWYYENKIFGIENVIANLYGEAKYDPNGDLEIEEDTENSTYKFSFGCIRKTVSGSDYFYKNEVSFTLGDSYEVATASISQEIYFANNYYEQNGQIKVRKGAEIDYSLQINATQTAGEKTAVNPYDPQNRTFTDFDILYKNQPIQEGQRISVSADSQIYLKIANTAPATATFEFDKMYFSDGKNTPVASHTGFYCEGFMADRESSTDTLINVKFFKGGEWTLVITTANVAKTIIFDVVGTAPTNLKAEVYYEESGFLTRESEETMVGREIIFRAVPNESANPAYVAVLYSGDISVVKLEKNKEENQWSFTAEKEGTYIIKMTSTAENNEKVYCTLTITVNEIPNLSETLHGDYTATDSANGVYLFSFNKESQTLSVTYTLGGTVKTETFEYSANNENLTITLNHISGDNLGIGLKINHAGKLVVEDPYYKTYILQAK